MKPPQHASDDCTGRWERVSTWVVCRGCNAAFLGTAGTRRRGRRENAVAEVLEKLTREGVKLREE